MGDGTEVVVVDRLREAVERDKIAEIGGGADRDGSRGVLSREGLRLDAPVSTTSGRTVGDWGADGSASDSGSPSSFTSSLAAGLLSVTVFRITPRPAARMTASRTSSAAPPSFQM